MSVNLTMDGNTYQDAQKIVVGGKEIGISETPVYATGTYTLASRGTTLEFDPELDFTPSIVIIELDTPDYTIDGCVGAVCATGFSTKIRNTSDGREYELLGLMETRTSYTTNANVQTNIEVLTPRMTISANSIIVPCRTALYIWQTGTYTWRAWA